MSTGDHQRTSRKKDRTSSTNNAGCSNAAKWPPLPGSFQYRMFGNRRSAHRRDGRCSSLGKTEQPVGTVTGAPADPEIHSLTCRRLSHYSRADEAPVPCSQ